MPSMEQTLEGSRNPYTVGVEVPTGIPRIPPVHDLIADIQQNIALIQEDITVINQQLEQRRDDILCILSEQNRIKDENKKAGKKISIQFMEMKERLRKAEETESWDLASIKARLYQLEGQTNSTTAASE